MADEQNGKAEEPDTGQPAQCPQCKAWHHADGSVSGTVHDANGDAYADLGPLRLLDAFDARVGQRTDGAGHAVIEPQSGKLLGAGTTAKDAVEQAQDTAQQLGRRRLGLQLRTGGTSGPVDHNAPNIKAADPSDKVQSGSLPEYLAPVVLKYPNGEPVIDPLTKAPYPLPPTLDMGKNIVFGNSIRGDIAAGPELAWRVATGQSMDYQRPLGLNGVQRKTPGWFVSQFTNVTAYNVGIVGAAAGFELDDVLRNSGRYNLAFGNSKNGKTPYGLSEERVKSIMQGYNDYANGKWADASHH